MPTRNPGALALVLSGGGARGAYELGVLKHVLGELVPQLGPEAIPRVLAGTSVGAINACCLGALAAAPGMGVDRCTLRVAGCGPSATSCCGRAWTSASSPPRCW